MWKTSPAWTAPAGSSVKPTNFCMRLVDSSPLPIIVFDTAGKITLWNPAAERVFGWRAEEVLGKPIPFIPEEKMEEHRACAPRTFAA